MPRFSPALTLPASNRLATRDRASRGSGLRPRVGGASSASRGRVLIVDDDVDTLEMYAGCMKAAGWAVETASNGAEALLVAPLFEPDVIVMDLNMPLVGGVDAIRRLKADDAVKHVPVVAMTTESALEAEARGAGSDEFRTKPCHPDTLRELLEETVRRRGRGPAGAPL